MTVLNAQCVHSCILREIDAIRNGSNRVRMFSEHMVIKRWLTLESSITMSTCAELITIRCFWRQRQYHAILKVNA
ncbi:unnamed protein product [Callosobruchus maculatus]|uniref:Uncharacterized protein n=1 Tax=Callosobruchus maculatus TaxID=64391 RepID=A0A653CTA6_CALMS|nr:unnamed protein product [Callosobruchus maculatus]